MKKKTNIIFNILIFFLLGVMAFSGYKLFGIKQDADANADQYEKLEQIVHNDEDKEETYTTSAEKYQSIYEMNNDFVGWIYIPDTPLDYPVVQTKDNPEYYLRRDFDKKYSDYGVPFMDFKCTVDESDNIIIYGHNMLNKTMFSAVESYARKAYWQEHPYVGFDTMNGFGTYEVAICARIDLTNTDFYYTDTVDFSSEQEFDDYIAKARAHAGYDTGVSLEYGDKLLLLSTCEYQYEDGRYIIIAKKISDEDLSAKINK
ncbi:MAG: class B sortase [Oscillospiraceae bacterium]|nr:class B sortase [Oscillospiraceae bacterium]